VRPACCADSSCADSESWSVPASFFFLPRAGPSVDAVAEDPRTDRRAASSEEVSKIIRGPRYYKKPRNTCGHYIEKNSAYYCKRAKYIDPNDVQASVACPITCAVCDIPDL